MEPEASSAPSGEKAVHVTGAECPTKRKARSCGAKAHTCAWPGAARRSEQGAQSAAWGRRRAAHRAPRAPRLASQRREECRPARRPTMHVWSAPPDASCAPAPAPAPLHCSEVMAPRCPRSVRSREGSPRPAAAGSIANCGAKERGRDTAARADTPVAPARQRAHRPCARASVRVCWMKLLPHLITLSSQAAGGPKEAHHRPSSETALYLRR